MERGRAFLRENSFPRWIFSVGEKIFMEGGGEPDFSELLKAIRN